MPHKTLRLAFAGTPQFAAEHLQVLIEQQYTVVAVYTQPDRPAGRGKQLKPSPVKSLAISHDIPVYQPSMLNPVEQRELLISLNIDVMVVVAYGLLLPQSILDIPVHGCINVHASLLPRWRGAAPIERAILNADTETGISIMQMDAGLDTGDILYAQACPISSQQNSKQLTEVLIKLGCDGLLFTLHQIQTKQLNSVPQVNEHSTYAKKLFKKESLINWDNHSQQIQRQINAFFPRMPAYCFFKGQRLRIITCEASTDAFNATPGTIININKQGLIIAAQHSSLLVSKVQFAGKSITSISDILNGNRNYFSINDILLNTEIAANAKK